MPSNWQLHYFLLNTTFKKKSLAGILDVHLINKQTVEATESTNLEENYSSLDYLILFLRISPGFLLICETEGPLSSNLTVR